MRAVLADLLAFDAVARRHNAGGLHPSMRAAIEADARFPVTAASPSPDAMPTMQELPENITVLSAKSTVSRRRA